MNRDPFTSFDPATAAPGIVSDFASRSTGSPARSARFVTESHALGVSAVNPRALVVAALVAVALIVIARRLTD